MDNTIGNRLKSLRKTRGLTLKQVADKIDYDWSNLSKIERGTYKKPLTEIIEKLANVYNVRLSEIFGENQELHTSFDIDDEWLELIKDMKERNLTPKQVEEYVSIVINIKNTL